MPSSLLLFLCLLSATNLCSCLSSSSSSSKANRKQEAFALSILAPPGKPYASTDDVTSVSGSTKRNGIVSLLKAEELTERKEAGSEVAGFEGKRRIEMDDVEGGPLSMEGSQVATILNDVVENLASLRDLVNNLKYQNHVMYKQMKKMQTKFCSSSSGQNRMVEESPLPHQHHQLLQQDGRYNSRDDHYSNVPGNNIVSLSLCLSVPLSFFLYVCLSLSVSRFFSLSLSVYVSLSLCLSLSLFVPLSLSLSLYVSLSVSVSRSRFPCISTYL